MLILIILCIVLIVTAFIRMLKNTDKKNLVYSVYVCICVIIACISYFRNIGWIRAAIVLVPALVLLIVYWKINRYSIDLIDKTNSLGRYVIFGGITMLLSNFLLPDFSDNGDEYVFFGKITDENIVSMCKYLFPFIIIVHVLLLIFQYRKARKVKKSLIDSKNKIEIGPVNENSSN